MRPIEDAAWAEAHPTSLRLQTPVAGGSLRMPRSEVLAMAAFEKREPLAMWAELSVRGGPGARHDLRGGLRRRKNRAIGGRERRGALGEGRPLSRPPPVPWTEEDREPIWPQPFWSAYVEPLACKAFWIGPRCSRPSVPSRRGAAASKVAKATCTTITAPTIP